MAVSRYLVVCHPLWARQHLGKTVTLIIITVVFISSIIFSLPNFWKKELYYVGNDEYMRQAGPMNLQNNEIGCLIYDCVYFVLGIAAPLMILVYCNIHLVWALKQAIKVRHQLSRNSRSSASKSNITMTMTLVFIIIFYILFVVPAEVLRFVWYMININNVDHISYYISTSYGLAVALCNALQSFNFAVNFILYSFINVHFRKVIKDLLLCAALRAHLHTHHNNVHL
jgi:hypothetical protein